MAKIEKMAISGIRSYSQNAASIIEFQTPLTLIVGMNGSGKTSIIECLNYIITGSLPPGTKQKAFIHDPKIAGEKEVKAQVKLRLQDITGNKLNVVRSMTATQKAKTIECKSLEGVIQKITPSGEKESISSRCTDFTKEMISRLGVSKPVIENVIFCHQEDANWPLSEGKVLKQKFDDIFSATRYIKALESIRNVRKDQDGSIKNFETELKYLVERKEESIEIQTSLTKAEGQKVVSQDQIKKTGETLIPLEERLAEIDGISENIFKVDKEIGNLQSTKDQLAKNIRDLEKKIKEPFQGSYNDLLRLQSEFKEKLELKETALGDLRSSVRRFDEEISKMAQQQRILTQKHGKFLQEEESFKGLVCGRDELVKLMATKYDVRGYDSGQYESPEVASFMNTMKDIHHSIDKEGKGKRDDHNTSLAELNSHMKKLEKSLHGFESGIEQKKKIIGTNNGKLSGIKNTLDSLGASENRIQSLELELSRAEADLKDFKLELNTDQSKQEINTLTAEKENEDRILSQLREEQGRMIQQSKAQTKVDILSKDKINKENTIESLLRRHEDTLDYLFETKPPREELKFELSQYMRSKQGEIRKYTNEYQRLSRDVAGKESKKKMMQDEYLNKEQTVSQSKQKMDDVCRENDYNEFRELIQEQVEKYSNTLVEIGAFEKIYQKYLRQLNSEDADEKGCPLCHRKFTSHRDIRNLIEELSQKLATVPEKRDENQSNLDDSKILNEKLMKLAPVKSVYDSLCEGMPALKINISNISGEIEKDRSTSADVESKKTQAEDAEKKGRSMESDIRKLDDCLFELKDLDRQLSTESSKLQGITPGRTMQSLGKEVREKQETSERLGCKIDKKKNDFMEYQNQLSIREKETNDLRSEKLKLQSQLQKRIQLEDQKAELSSTNQSYEREIRDASTLLQPIKDELKEKTEKKKDIEMAKERNDDETRMKLDKIKAGCSKIKEKSEAIEKYINDGKESDLRNNEEQLNNIGDRLNIKGEAMHKKKKEMTNIQEEITNQNLRQREIDDNIKLLETQKKIEKIQTNMEELKVELSQFGSYRELTAERSNLQGQIDKYRKEKANFEGRLKGFEDEIKRYNRELTSSKYAEADLRHCEKLVEIKTTQLANKDLDKYYKALDHAISRYHRLKLAEINKIIKEYWVKTYQGNDIETIEIVTEDDTESGASKARRNFNYRVSMVKGGISLDMRSRCSAGQKVLASIIIRLALAETFCLNCGILALDEPTTNLDEANVESLANALKDIINTRMQQKNFQLIVITHDEEFVQGLGRSDYVEYYFRIYKDENGFSRIHRQPIEDRE